jgi:hypothetical protein
MPAGQETHTEQEVVNFVAQLMEAIDAQVKSGKTLDNQLVQDMLKKQLNENEQGIQNEIQKNLQQMGYGNNHSPSLVANIQDEIKRQKLDFQETNVKTTVSQSVRNHVLSQHQAAVTPETQDRLAASVVFKKMLDDMEKGKLTLSSRDLANPQALAQKLQAIPGDIRKNEHWDKVREIDHDRSQYLFAKDLMERADKGIKVATKNLETAQKNLKSEQHGPIGKFFSRFTNNANHDKRIGILENEVNKRRFELNNANNELEQAKITIEVIRAKHGIGAKDSSKPETQHIWKNRLKQERDKMEKEASEKDIKKFREETEQRIMHTSKPSRTEEVKPIATSWSRPLAPSNPSSSSANPQVGKDPTVKMQMQAEIEELKRRLKLEEEKARNLDRQLNEQNNKQNKGQDQNRNQNKDQDQDQNRNQNSGRNRHQGDNNQNISPASGPSTTTPTQAKGPDITTASSSGTTTPTQAKAKGLSTLSRD